MRAFAALAVLIYVAEALVWPLHATRGSYFHSLAAFYPFAMALVALGGETWLARFDQNARRIASYGTLVAVTALAVFGLTNWDASFNEPYRARVAALDLIPPGPFLAIDAAAWRWISDRSVLLSPALHIAPEDAKWWYVFGSATLCAFIVQVASGVALAFSYISSSSQVVFRLTR